MRMTKPKFVNHSTTGMFNYVVKDPDSSRLSGEFWIKDQIGISLVLCPRTCWSGTYMNEASFYLLSFLICSFPCRSLSERTFLDYREPLSLSSSKFLASISTNKRRNNRQSQTYDT